jgi:hypothetical protein
MFAALAVDVELCTAGDAFRLADFLSDVWSAIGVCNELFFFSDGETALEESKVARCVGAGGNGISRGLRWKVKSE